MAEDMGERSEDPTPRRKNEARQEGNVAKSQDLASAGFLIVVFVVLIALGGSLITSSASLLRRTLDPANGLAILDPQEAITLTIDASIQFAKLLIPMLLILAFAAGVFHFIQVGWLFTLKPLQPKLDKLNVVKGMQKFINKRKLVKGGIDILKFALVASVAALNSVLHMGDIVALPSLTTGAALVVIGKLILLTVIWLLLILLALGVIDLIFQRWKHKEELKMTKQEVKDERKSSEGDPAIKNKRMRMYQQLIMQQIQSTVPNADVIVTNPTHFAIALKYDASSMHAPRVVAKGGDHMAIRIRLVAAANNVAIVERPPLARALYYNVDVGHEIPVEYFESVAEVLAFVYRLEGRAAS
ncbi:MAG: flagellar biosynthesis protein FlhB [Planctomycetota bacterium]|jgi:flagellar biosynthetic protein FlhB